jgi:signal transduction histidine kinase
MNLYRSTPLSSAVSGTAGDCAAGSARTGRRGAAVLALSTVAVAGLVAATVVGELFGSDRPGAALLALDIAVGVLGCAALPLLARWPVPTAVVLAALAAVSPAATPAATVGTLQVARVRPFRTAVAVAGAGAAGQVTRWGWRPLPGLAFGWWLLLVLVAHVALVGWGALAQARRALIASLAERARRAEAEATRRLAETRLLERTRIAREMHDVLGHRLSLLATYAGALEFRPDAPADQLARAAGVVRVGAHQALEELREIIGVLRDGPDDAAGGLAADGGRPLPTLADLPRLVGESRDAGVQVQVDDRVADPSAVPPGTGRAAYRIVQEGLTNARKHAGGQPVRLAVAGRAGGRLDIEIRNPLAAARPAAAGNGQPAGSASGGTGLVGLAERVQLAGGQVDHGVTVAGEFRLHAWLPWPAAGVPAVAAPAAGEPAVAVPVPGVLAAAGSVAGESVAAVPAAGESIAGESGPGVPAPGVPVVGVPLGRVPVTGEGG